MMCIVVLEKLEKRNDEETVDKKKKQRNRTNWIEN